MGTTQIDTIIAAIKAALSRRDERRDILAAKIRELAEVALDAARRRSIDLGEIGRLEYRRPQADCSQWANRVDFPAHVGEPVLVLVGVEVRSLGPVPNVGFYDGQSMQHQMSETVDATSGRAIRPATVKQLKAVAAALPAALAALLAERQAAAEAQAAEADAAAKLDE